LPICAEVEDQAFCPTNYYNIPFFCELEVETAQPNGQEQNRLAFRFDDAFNLGYFPIFLVLLFMVFTIRSVGNLTDRFCFGLRKYSF